MTTMQKEAGCPIASVGVRIIVFLLLISVFEPVPSSGWRMGIKARETVRKV